MSTIFCCRFFVPLTLTLLTLLYPATSFGVEKTGVRTGLPIPRFVSLKSDSVNLRKGPGKRHPIEWHYTKRGLPVEIIQEFDNWRRIRDSGGTTGWVHHSLLSSRRMGLVAPWDRETDSSGKVISSPLYDSFFSPTEGSSISARLESGLLVELRECSDDWCFVSAGNIKGWLPQIQLWGTYPGEEVR